MTREREIYKVTLVGSAGNVALLTFKFVAGFVGHSSAMIADAVHSLSDFLTDLVVLAFVRVSSKPQDESHDYGHGKYETMAAFLVALALLAAAAGIIVSGSLRLWAWSQGEQLAKPGMVALWAAIVSIAVKEGLYQYTVIKGRRLDSPAVVSNAWHHRSDALSSIGAALGIGMLIKVSVDLLKRSVGELTDGSLPEDMEHEIVDIITAQPHVSEPHHLRTRRIGNCLAIEVHVRMDGDMSLAEAHRHVTLIEQSLKQRFGASTLVTIHMEPIPS